MFLEAPPTLEIQLMLVDLSPEDQQRLWRRAARATPVSWIVGLGAVAFAALGVIFGSHIGGSVGILVVVAVVYIGWHIEGQLRAKMALVHVRRELASIGRCAGCGYDLRGTCGTCPECGAPV